MRLIQDSLNHFHWSRKPRVKKRGWGVPVTKIPRFSDDIIFVTVRVNIVTVEMNFVTVFVNIVTPN
jgi:hypothetical protein